LAKNHLLLLRHAIPEIQAEVPGARRLADELGAHMVTYL